MNSPASIETETPPETLLVEEELLETSLPDGEPPVLTEEATPDVAFSQRPDRLLRALIYCSVLVVGLTAGGVLVYSLSGSRPAAPAAESPVSESAVPKPEDAVASASRRQLENVAAAAEGGNEPVANSAAESADMAERTPPVAEPKSPMVVARAPMTALEAAVAAARARSAPARTEREGASSSQRQAAVKTVKTAECSLMGDDIATFRRCVEKFNQ
jgi:hypothetical protein